jgi:glycosyltransferase involved in cell wall biosynthesis
MTSVERIPSLSIVIPVYNEPHWIARTVEDAVIAVSSSPFEAVELVIVDDGSNAETQQALEALKPPIPLRILRQENAGRFAARTAGIRAARHDFVLLLDSRVSLDREALAFVASCLDGDGARPVWNGHVEVDVEGNPFARVWKVITDVAWAAYLDKPRTTSFGLEEYDRFPKGTTCFLAPRTMLLDAIEGFKSLYDDPRHANDDTLLIRSIAARQRINISPSFACRYTARDSLGPFLRHTFHRGTVFLDAFARPGTRFFPVVVAFFPVSIGFGVLAFRRPATAVALAAATPVAAAAAGIALRRPWRDVASLALLAPPFAAVYAAGIWRGALMAMRTRLAR